MNSKYLNKIFLGDCITQMRTIEDESVDLVIADPPYWKVVSESWDYKWKTKDEYIKWSLKWISEVYRVLRKGGTFYMFGYFRMLSYFIPYLDEMKFELKQQIILNKGIRAVSGRATKNYKIFPNVTESILFLVKDSKPFIKNFLKDKQKILNLSAKTINEQLGVKSNGGGMWSIYTGKNVCEQVPTEALWNKLSSILQFNYPYNKIAQTFNTQMGYTDVWDDINFYEKHRIHPTQKPEKLIERLIIASSNVGDLVLDPFMGSGTTAICSQNLNRNFVGFETNEVYYEKSLLRLKQNIPNSNTLQLTSI